MNFFYHFIVLCFYFLKSSFKTFDDRCSACLLRGGLLLNPDSSSCFIHAICSIFQAYEPTISSSSSQIKSCCYCWSFCPLNFRRISTHCFVSCKHTKCNNQFHVTCGLISGCTFEIDYDYLIIYARCHLHAIPHQSSININKRQSSVDKTDYETTERLDNRMDIEKRREQQQEHDVDDDDDHDHDHDHDDDEIVAANERVPIGGQVILNDVNETKIGEVIEHEITFHYAVDFGDGSYSHDMCVTMKIKQKLFETID